MVDVTPSGQVISVYSERVPLKNFRERYWALKAQVNVTVAVSGIQPYTDMIMQISAEDPSLLAARYVSRTGMEIYDAQIWATYKFLRANQLGCAH